MHGIGNDFVLVNGFASGQALNEFQSLAPALCDRKFGIGSDGLIVALPGESNPFQMRMWNPDGSESEMCGNGIRCFALFLHDQGLTQEKIIPVETGAGLLTLEIVAEGKVKVNMGLARLTRAEIGMANPTDESFVNQVIDGTTYRGTAVSMGNPHVVIFADNIDSIELEKIGPEIEKHPLFPTRVNVHFVQVLSESHIKQRTWERGAGLTLACGTGACACAVASYLNGYSQRNVTVSLPGGDLLIEYLESGFVLMTGPAETVFEGYWNSDNE